MSFAVKVLSNSLTEKEVSLKKYFGVKFYSTLEFDQSNLSRDNL